MCLVAVEGSKEEAVEKQEPLMIPVPSVIVP